MDQPEKAGVANEMFPNSSRSVEEVRMDLDRYLNDSMKLMGGFRRS